MAKIILEVLGGGREVGRLSVFVRPGNSDKGVLLDCGINFDDQGNPQLPLYVSPKNIKAAVLTHAHLDHTGGLPLYFVTLSFPVLSTSITKAILRPLMNDFLHISGYYLPFEYEEVAKMLRNIKTVNYGDIVEVDNFTLEFVNAGHIPGSMSVILHANSKSMLFTGDINLIETELTIPARYHNSSNVDYLVMETTYAITDHPPRESEEKRFIEAVREVIDNNGTVLIPAFSVSRSQEILIVLTKYGVDAPIFYDGMVREINRIFLAHSRFLKNPSMLRRALRISHEIKGWQDRKAVLKERPAVIVASSGMLRGGPSIYYLKKIYDDPRNAIFLVSFQAPNTPGRMILEKGVFEQGGPRIKARVEWFDFSSHAGKTQLIKVIDCLKSSLEKIILVHGESEAQETFAREVYGKFGIETIISSNNAKIEL